MQSARLGDSFLPPTDARTCKSNHRGIEGEHWAQCALVRRCKEEHTLTEHQSWGCRTIVGFRMVNWESQSKTPTESGRRTHLLYFTHSYSILSCGKKGILSLDCLFCGLTSPWTSISISTVILHLTSSRFCLYLLIFMNLMTHVQTRTYRETHTPTYMYD